jgi:chromosome segregation ATPase
MVDQLERAIARLETISSEVESSVSKLETGFRVLEKSVENLVEKHQGIKDALSHIELRLRTTEQAIDKANLDYLLKRIETLEGRLMSVEKEGIGINARQAIIAGAVMFFVTTILSAVIGQLVAAVF